MEEISALWQLGELLDRTDEWMTGGQNAIAWRRQILERMAPVERATFRRHVRMVREGIDELITVYATPFDGTFRNESLVSNASPERLIGLMDTEREDRLSLHRRFEAFRNFDVGFALHLIDQHDPMEVVEDDMHEIVRFIRANLFSGSITRTVYTLHDKEHYHVSEVFFEDVPAHLRGSTHLLASQLTCRTLADGTPVLMHDRPKRPFGTLLKVIKQMRDPKKRLCDPLEVRDRRGLKFAVHDSATAMRLIQRLSDLCGKDIPFVRDIGNSNLSGALRKMDPNNGHSDERFRAEKCEMVWGLDHGRQRQGKPVEILFQDFESYFSSQYATDTLNHKVYRLRQLIDVYGPFLWPASVYEVDWGSSRTESRLNTWVSQQFRIHERIATSSGTLRPIRAAATAGLS